MLQTGVQETPRIPWLSYLPDLDQENLNKRRGTGIYWQSGTKQILGCIDRK